MDWGIFKVIFTNYRELRIGAEKLVNDLLYRYQPIQEGCLKLWGWGKKQEKGQVLKQIVCKPFDEHKVFETVDSISVFGVGSFLRVNTKRRCRSPPCNFEFLLTQIQKWRKRTCRIENII